jgi:repressor of nif and glnA expression
METVLVLSVKPHGYTAKEVAETMKEKLDRNYFSRNASYDLRKLRGKGLVEKKKGTRKYITTNEGLQTIIMVSSLIRNQIPKL